VTGAEAVGAVSLPVGERLLGAFYLNELLLRLVQRHDANRELFGCYRDALAELTEGDEISSLLRVFEKRLLQLLGYGLVLDHDVDTGIAIDAAADYCYVAQHGPVHDPSGTRSGVRVRGATLRALADEHFESEQQRSEARRLLRAVFDELLGPRPLATRELLRDLRGEQQRRPVVRRSAIRAPRIA